MARVRVRDAHEEIANRRDFNAGNMRGEHDRPWNRYGNWLPEWAQELYQDQEILYTVYSYATPIGWYDGSRDTWVIPKISYSATTSRHQGQLRYGAQLHGGSIELPRMTPKGVKIKEGW